MPAFRRVALAFARVRHRTQRQRRAADPQVHGCHLRPALLPGEPDRSRTGDETVILRRSGPTSCGPSTSGSPITARRRIWSWMPPSRRRRARAARAGRPHHPQRELFGDQPPRTRATTKSASMPASAACRAPCGCRWLPCSGSTRRRRARGSSFRPTSTRLLQMPAPKRSGQAAARSSGSATTASAQPEDRQVGWRGRNSRTAVARRAEQGLIDPVAQAVDHHEVHFLDARRALRGYADLDVAVAQRPAILPPFRPVSATTRMPRSWAA